MSTTGNPLIQQGLLNRVLTHIVVPAFPQLNVEPSYMAKSQAVVSFDGPFVDQEPTAVGIVNSPRPFVMGKLVINLLRSQSLSNLWILQTQTVPVLGAVVAYSDSTTFSSIPLANCSIIDFDPGAFDGADPTVKVTVSGVFYTAAYLWTGV